jgi:hypothetical protein
LPIAPGSEARIRAGGYDLAHRRVVELHGSASSYACTDCGAAASEWSFNDDDPAYLADPRTGCLFSTDPSHYSPRCRPCHRTRDWAARRPQPPPLDTASVIADYRAGISIKSIAAASGHPPKTISEALRSANIQMSPSHRNRATDDQH